MSDELREKILAGLSKLYSRKQIIANPSLVPERGGFNAWFFKGIPADTPTEGCFKKDGLTLLYVGISPVRASSQRNLHKRIVDDHCKGPAKTSTLRTSLGVLLVEESGYPLQKISGTDKMSFSPAGEDWLNDWMDKNAFVCWYEHPTPWEIKEQVITAFSPPLNIQGGTHPFRKTLKGRRVEAKRLAREMPVVHE